MKKNQKNQEIAGAAKYFKIKEIKSFHFLLKRLGYNMTTL